MIPLCGDKLQEEAMLKILRAAEIEDQRRRLADHRAGISAAAISVKMRERKYGKWKEDEANE